MATPVVDALQAYYELLVDPRGVLRTAGGRGPHVSDCRRRTCRIAARPETPFVGSCDFDGARQLLEHLYGSFGTPAASVKPGALVDFSQSSYAQATDADGLGARGWLYVPAACWETAMVDVVACTWRFTAASRALRT